MPDINSNHSLTIAQNMTDIAKNALFSLKHFIQIIAFVMSVICFLESVLLAA
jgi:hypothetical protein